MQDSVKIENLPENEKNAVVESVNKAVNFAVEKLNEDQAGEYYFKLGDVRVYFNGDGKADLHVTIYYVTKFMEISWAISEALDPEELGVSEEELEKMFDEAYQEQLEEINDEYGIYMDSDIRLDLGSVYDGLSELVINTSPVTCERDYCEVGLEIKLHFKNASIEFLKENGALLWSIIYDAVDRVVRLALL